MLVIIETGLLSQNDDDIIVVRSFDPTSYRTFSLKLKSNFV